MKHIFQKLKIFYLAMMVITATACSEWLQEDLKEVVPADENYKNDFDSRSAAIGIIGTFQQSIADQYILFGELRGDLLDVTHNADEYMRQLSAHNPETNNPYIDPSNFYKIILSCNDALAGLNDMKKSKKVGSSAYNRDFSDITGYRAFTYYILALNYGTVPYITEPINSIDDVKNATFPMLTTDEVVNRLIIDLQAIPSPGLTDWALTLDQYSGTNRMFVDKMCVLADLYLWKGDRTSLLKADSIYKSMFNDQALDKFKTSYKFGYNYSSKGSFTWNNMFKTYPSLGDFGGLYTGELYNEWRWYCVVDKRFDQSNSLVKWFSNTNGSYILRPSEASIGNWHSQYLINGQPGDLRGEGASWNMEGGQPVVGKYLLQVRSPYDNDADLYMYRTGSMFLKFAEAANRLGYCNLAMAMLNPKTTLAADPAGAVKGSPFRFDTLKSPNYSNRATYSETYGVRGRCYVAPIAVPNMPTLQDSIIFIEDIISQEYALELAYEGDRWPNLLRIAHHREKEKAGSGAEFLSKTIARKFESKGDAATAAQVRARLLDPKNWYLPLKK